MKKDIAILAFSGGLDSTISVDWIKKNYGYESGKELGKKLKEIEDFWVENSFKISDQELKKIVNN